MKKVITGTIVAIGLCIAAGCGSATSSSPATHEQNTTQQQDAGEFMKELVHQTVLGQWGPRWETLISGQQKVVTRSAYMACRAAGDSVPQIDNVEIVDQYKEPITVPGVGNVQSTAVTMKLTGDNVDESMTGHAVNVDGSWHWVMIDGEYEAYKAGNCPS